MRKSVLLLCILFLSAQSYGQVTSDQVDLGAGYVNQVYYHFNGTKTTVAASSWDLGFCTNLMDGAVINNPVTTSVYRIEGADTLDYPYIVDTAGLDLAYQYNSDSMWFKGAFNRSADVMNPFDFGWGLYDFATHKVIGNSLFIVKKGDDFYKLWIRTKEANGDSYVRYAKLDGSADQDAAISTVNYSSKNFVYLSLSSPAQLDLEPASSDWHLFFGRYITPVEGLGPYPVTGVLTNAGTESAEARGVDLNTVSYTDYEGDYVTDISEIGYDWKYFDMNIFQYVLVDSLLYFVKTSGGAITSIRFVDFNNATGAVSFDIENLLTSVSGIHNELTAAATYPNPATEKITVIYQSVRNAAITSLLYDISGREVFRYEFTAAAGLNTQTIELPQLSGGIYQLLLNSEYGSLPLKIMIAP